MRRFVSIKAYFVTPFYKLRCEQIVLAENINPLRKILLNSALCNTSRTY